MSGWKIVDKYHIKLGNYTITKVGKPEYYPLPYQLYRVTELLGSFETSEKAKGEAR